MEEILKSLGGGFDLAAVASGAGLLGGGTSTMIALAIGGRFLRFIVRTFLTAALTGVGFYFLLGALGFQIVPKTDTASAGKPEWAEGLAGTESARRAAENDPDGERTYYISSPFRRDG